MTERVDAVIIGTGQAGKPLAGALAEAGWRTVIIERGRVGGTCIIDGCTPSKTLIASARVAQLVARARDYGIVTSPPVVDMEAVRARKRDVVDKFSASSERGMTRHDALELVFGEATFADAHTVDVRSNDGGRRRFAASRIFINTGSRPLVPSIPGLTEVPFLDSTSVMELGDVPDHLLVLGGGFVGLEFAQMFRRFGAKVSVIEQEQHIAGREDEDVAEALMGILREDGIAFRLGATARRVWCADRGIALEIETAGRSTRIDGSHLLVAVGRVPNTDSLGLAAAGIECDENGYIQVSDRLETGVAGVYALGEVNGGPPFTHVAYDDFRVVRARLLDGGGFRSRQDRLLAYTVFTDPQLGRVGLTEREARDRGTEVKIARLSMARVARAIETGETRGFMKAIVDARSERILGAAVLGVEGGEVAAVIQTAMMGDLPYTALRDGVYAHPTLAESVNNLFMELD